MKRKPGQPFTDEESKFLIENYPQKGKLFCAEYLSRSEGSVRSQASKLGLRIDKNSEFFNEFQERAKLSKIGKKRPEHSALMKRYAKEGKIDTFIHPTDERRIQMSITAKQNIAKNGHPKGMLGKTHSESVKKGISERAVQMWEDPNSYVNTSEYRQIISDRFSKSMQERLAKKPTSVYSNGKRGTIEIGGKKFFARSSWEANIAAYFEFLKSKNEIKDWFHEPETFWFEKIRRGVRSYLPDFKIINHNDTSYFVEVKGWMDAKSKTKIKRMAIYYPEIRLDVIDEKRYKGIAKSKSLIPGWGALG